MNKKVAATLVAAGVFTKSFFFKLTVTDNNNWHKMTRAIAAVYEDGFFKPVRKINLKEHAKVKLIIKPENLTQETSGLVRIGKKSDINAGVAMMRLEGTPNPAPV